MWYKSFAALGLNMLKHHCCPSATTFSESVLLILIEQNFFQRLKKKEKKQQPQKAPSHIIPIIFPVHLKRTKWSGKKRGM